MLQECQAIFGVQHTNKSEQTQLAVRLLKLCYLPLFRSHCFALRSSATMYEHGVMQVTHMLFGGYTPLSQIFTPFDYFRVFTTEYFDIVFNPIVWTTQAEL